MAEMQTFWNGDHPLSKQANELQEKLVPGSGQCETLAGEFLRASSKIQHDWYNNGWGCNNWSGAVVFLEKYQNFLGMDAETKAKFNESLEYVHDYSHGERAGHLNYNGTPCRHVTNISAIVVQAILNNPKLMETPNPEDMWDLCEPDAPYEEDEDEEGEGW